LRRPCKKIGKGAANKACDGQKERGERRGTERYSGRYLNISKAGSKKLSSSTRNKTKKTDTDGPGQGKANPNPAKTPNGTTARCLAREKKKLKPNGKNPENGARGKMGGTARRKTTKQREVNVLELRGLGLPQGGLGQKRTIRVYGKGTRLGRGKRKKSHVRGTGKGKTMSQKGMSLKKTTQPVTTN